MNSTPAPLDGLAALTPSKEAAKQAIDKAENPNAGLTIKAIVHVTLYETHSDAQLKYREPDIGFAELSVQFAAMSKHFAQLAAQGKDTHDFPPDNKAKAFIPLTPDDLPNVEGER